MKVQNIFRGLKQCVTNVSISPDEKFIAATSSDNVFIIWHAQDYSIVHNKILEQPIGLSKIFTFST
jgi:cilia- and flagella-associated protein 52